MQKIKSSLFLKSLLLVLTLFIIRYLLAIFIFYMFPQALWKSTGEDFTYTNTNLVEAPREIETNLDTFWHRWDTYHYVKIATDGYDKAKYSDNVMFNWAFYPMYPVSVAFVKDMLGVKDARSVFYIAVVVANVFFVLAIYFLLKLMKLLRFSKEEVITSVLLLNVFPAAYFYNLAYSESLYLLLSVLSLYLLFKKKLVLAAWVLGFALATRVTAVTLLIPFGIYALYFMYKTMSIPKMMAYIAGLTTIVLTPISLYYLYLYGVTGEYWAAFKVQKAWNNQGAFPLRIFYDYVKDYGFKVFMPHILTIVLLVVVGVITIILIKKYWGTAKSGLLNGLTFEYATLLFYGILIYLVSSGVRSRSSIFRYLAIDFALLLVAVKVFKISYKSPVLTVLMIFASGIQTLFYTLFMTGTPVYGF